MTLKTLQAKAHEAYNKVGHEILEGNSNLNAAELMYNCIDEIVASTIKEVGTEVEKELNKHFSTSMDDYNVAYGTGLTTARTIIRSLTETK